MDRHGHDWRIVAPWYRWALADGSDPGRAADAARPAFHKYVSTGFVADFLSDPQRSVVFDPTIDVLQRVEPIPAAELLAVDGRLKSLSRTRLVPTQTRKLFLAAHQRFYLVAIGLHCDRVGFPHGRSRQRRRGRVRAFAGAGCCVPNALVPEAADADARTQPGESDQPGPVPARRAPRSGRGCCTRSARPVATGSPHRERRPSPPPARSSWPNGGCAPGPLRTRSKQRTEGWVPRPRAASGPGCRCPTTPKNSSNAAIRCGCCAPAADDPDHAARDGTIYYASVPTASDEITPDGRARFNELDTYEIRVFARAKHGNCPGRLVWSEPTQPFRLASFYDPFGSAQRPTEIRLPDFKELEASAALPSVRMTQPAGSSLEFSKIGDIPTKGKAGGPQEICFFSIPMITIIAMFVLNLFLPIVMFVFGLWWMLKLKFCIPPSIEFEADLAAELDVEPPELQLMADIDVDVIPGTDPEDVANVLKNDLRPTTRPRAG